MGRARAPRTAVTLLGILSVLLLVAGGASAHVAEGGGPVRSATFPTWLIWLAGALVVAGSFVLLGVYARNDPAREQPHDGAPGDQPITPRSPWWRLIGWAGLVSIVAPGLLGLDLAWPAVLAWVLLWSGLPLVAYLFGDPWPHISPFVSIGRLADRLRPWPVRAYPRRLGVWPSVAVLVAGIGMEVAGAPWNTARTLSALGLAYILMTFLGGMLWGHAWLRHGEAIGRLSAWWGRVALLREGVMDRLGRTRATGTGETAFVVALLYGVNYDVFENTAAARGLAAHLPAAWASAILLVAGYLLFLGLYTWCGHAMRKATGADRIGTTMGTFAASLLPIAVGYHLAHNLPYLLTQAPVVAGALTGDVAAAWPLSASLAQALPWFQVVLIVTAHVAAVLVAHRIAFSSHPSRVQAIRSELPLTLAMVAYTLVGLSLLGAGS